MFALVTTALLLAGASSQAQSTTSASPSAPVAAAAPAQVTPEKKVCRREQEVGSIMPKRTCRTQAEWAAIDRQLGGDAEAQLQDWRSRHSD
jgi:hypothetical protein